MKKYDINIKRVENLMNRFSSKLLFISLVIAVSLLLTGTAQTEQCFSIIVGKDASANGYVMLGHNEDNGPPLAVNHRKMPRQNHKTDDVIKLVNGGEFKQVGQTWAYIWSEIPGATFSDGYVNEWGVCVASDKCPSKEDQPELTDGGISYMFRRIIAQRAKSARDGIRIAAELIEKFGYDSSGRSYMICDPEEGWVFCAIYGKRWLAQRVPDDEVAVIANSYSVRAVNLADTGHFLASEGIINYAQSRGWYNPKSDTIFDFAKVFADPHHAGAAYNLYRQWGGLRYLTDKKIELNQNMPFSIKPNRKLEVFDIINILRDHYEGTEAQDLPENAISPHENKYHTICNDDTYNSFVVELRRDKPLDIGIVYWACLGNPCSSFYIPFHFGIDQFPEAYFTLAESPTDAYFQKMTSPDSAEPMELFWRYLRYANKLQANHPGYYERLSSVRGDFENRLLTAKANAEKTALEHYDSDKSQANSGLKKFFTDQYLGSFKEMEKSVIPDKHGKPKQDIAKLKKSKSPTAAFILSLVGGATILPGLGQHYNGEHNKGLLMGAGWLVGMAILFPTEGTEHEKTGQIIGMPLLLSAYIWSCIDAPISANKINKRLREQNTYGHMLEFYKKHYTFGFDLNISERVVGPRLTVHF